VTDDVHYDCSILTLEGSVPTLVKMRYVGDEVSFHLVTHIICEIIFTQHDVCQQQCLDRFSTPEMLYSITTLLRRQTRYLLVPYSGLVRLYLDSMRQRKRGCYMLLNLITLFSELG